MKLEQRKNNRISYMFLLLFMLFAAAFAMPVFAKNADDLYREGKFAEAEKEYRKADMDNPKDIRFRYNRGCAAYQNKDYQGAEAAFSSVIRRTNDKEIMFKAAYNLGNTAFTQEDFASAVEFYKQAVMLNPENADAKYNLELSLKRLEDAKKNPQKKDKDKKDKNEKGDKGDRGNKDNKDNKDKGKRDNDRDDKSDKGNDFNDKSGDLKTDPMGEKSKAELSPAEMLSRKKAEALLDNVKEDRAKILQHQTREGKRSAGSGKNW